MKHVRRILNVLLVVLLLSLVVVGEVFAQGDEGGELLAPFASILAAAVSVERVLQLIRNIVSPSPDEGPLARGSKALRYYTTIGGAVLGLIIVFVSDLRLLESVGVGIDPIVDAIFTGVVVGLGSELAHEVIKLATEAKGALRRTNR